MPTTWYSAEVVDIEEMNQHVRRYFLQPEVDFPVFKSGQFITLDLPVSDKRLQRWKSYSIANAPQPGGLIELCIVRHPEGSGTGYIFNEVHKGSKLVFKGPDGGFVLPQNLEDLHLVMICTGTGIAPFRSMINHVIEQGLAYKHIHLIFGGRTKEDILYRKEFELLRDQLPGFSYDVALSREPLWPGYKGYIHQIYKEKYAEVQADVMFYLCGWTQMIDEAVAHLVSEMGYAPNRVKYELYG